MQSFAEVRGRICFHLLARGLFFKSLAPYGKREQSKIETCPTWPKDIKLYKSTAVKTIHNFNPISGGIIYQTKWTIGGIIVEFNKVISGKVNKSEVTWWQLVNKVKLSMNSREVIIPGAPPWGFRMGGNPLRILRVSTSISLFLRNEFG